MYTTTLKAFLFGNFTNGRMPLIALYGRVLIVYINIFQITDIGDRHEWNYNFICWGGRGRMGKDASVLAESRLKQVIYRENGESPSLMGSMGHCKVNKS